MGVVRKLRQERLAGPETKMYAFCNGGNLEPLIKIRPRRDTIESRLERSFLWQGR